MKVLHGLLIVLVTGSAAHAQLQSCISLDEVNAQLAGRILDYTHNHGEDNRIWSSILGMHRDLYVYVPPGFCDCDSTGTGYPLVLWLHGGFGDEHAFLDTAQIIDLDKRIRCGQCPPMIVACPDGICSGRNCILAHHSFYVNSAECGRFEDHVIQEIVPFLVSNFGVDPDCQKHALIGVSAGGFGAMSLALQHPELFGYVATLAGAVNMRYSNCNSDYFENFSPATYRWDQDYAPLEVIGRFGYLGLIKFRAWVFIRPVFGRGDDVIGRIAAVNPADLLFRTGPKSENLEMFIAYGKQDEFNMDAQAESFIWFASRQGIPITRYVDPQAGHDFEFFRASQKAAWNWLCGRFAAAQPPLATEIAPDPFDNAFVPPSPEESAVEE